VGGSGSGCVWGGRTLTSGSGAVAVAGMDRACHCGHFEWSERRNRGRIECVKGGWGNVAVAGWQWLCLWG
jgi:hypothetical protein